MWLIYNLRKSHPVSCSALLFSPFLSRHVALKSLSRYPKTTITIRYVLKTCDSKIFICSHGTTSLPHRCKSHLTIETMFLSCEVTPISRKVSLTQDAKIVSRRPSSISSYSKTNVFILDSRGHQSEQCMSIMQATSRATLYL
jgi:hypothetical protein